VLEFIAGRLRGWLQEQGFAVEVINAVLAEQPANPYRALIGARELSEWVKHSDWAETLDGFARCVRITRTEPEIYPVDERLFQQDEERALYAAYQQAASRLETSGNVDAFLTAFAPMVPAVAAYFGTGKGDGVLVHADDVKVRRNPAGAAAKISAMQRPRRSERAGGILIENAKAQKTQRFAKKIKGE
jgi:glycyl-tRNA synthetase beta subunit